MKRFLRMAAVLAGCAAGLVSGCATNGACNGPACGLSPGPYVSNMNLYDPCYPDRYTNLAQRSVNAATAPQVLNGHVLEQTVWNSHFEQGTDRLNETGLTHLQHLARRRPCPDRNIYLATSLDIKYDPNCPDRYCGARQELDTLRTAAVQKYLTGLNCGRGQEFSVVVHDPNDPSIHTQGINYGVNLMYQRYRGGLPSVAGGGAGGGGGTSTGGGGGGGTGR